MKYFRIDFRVSKYIIDKHIILNGAEIYHNKDGDTSILMETYVNEISFMDTTYLKKETGDRRATEKEVRLYRKLAGELV